MDTKLINKQVKDWLCHDIDFHSKDPGLFSGRHPLQTKLPADKLHREFHLDLNREEMDFSFTSP